MDTGRKLLEQAREALHALYEESKWTVSLGCKPMQHVDSVLASIDAHLSAAPAEPTEARQAAVQPDRWTASHYSKKQAEWCRMYERETTFEPLMCDYEAGNESFVEAAKMSISWFESWSCDAHLRVGDHHIPGARRFA